MKAFVACVFLLVVACGDDDAAVCIPGESQACVGPGGCMGGQVCADDGSRFEMCDCSGADAGMDASVDAGSDAGSDAASDASEDVGADTSFDAGPTTECADLVTGDSIVYLLFGWDVPIEADGELPGFDLDDVDSGSGSTLPDATCAEASPDFLSPYDEGPGVDNAGAGLRSTIETAVGEPLAEALQQRFLAGLAVFAVEVTNIDDPLDDPDVEVRWLRAQLASELMLGPDDRPLPLQELITTDATPAISAELVGGRLRARFSRATLPGLLPTELQALPLALDDAELAMDICAGSVERGVIGGSEAIADVAMRVPVDTRATVLTVLESFADLVPSDEPAVCEDISVGYTFEAVVAALGA